MSSAPSSSKRTTPQPLSGRDRKRAKTRDARTIATAATAAAGKSVNVTLPGSIDVEKFANARAFEITAMENAIENARGAGAQRAFQSLPRHLRRRAASHNPNRIPLRLREKAIAEMKTDNTKIRNSKKKLRKKGGSKQANAPARTTDLLTRQVDKTWLETHIWHAKRMKMINIWVHRLAKHPTEKSHRPSYRAAAQGSIIHDASYMATIELRGRQNALSRVLALLADPSSESPSSPRYLSGARTLPFSLHRPSAYPLGLLAPVSLLWRPLPPSSDPDSSSSDPIRQVWLRVHPAGWPEVLPAVREAAASVDGVEVQDLRGHFNVFEMMGPRSSQVITGALKLAKDQPGGRAARLAWHKISKAATSGSLPTGVVCSFLVDDPRLSFPPTNSKLSESEDTSAHDLSPSATLAQSTLWDEETRVKIAKPTYKKIDLDKRREKNLVPGTPLTATPSDDRVPILLIQRTLASPSPTSSSRALHGWTLIVPSGWAMPFWTSLTHTGTRIAGLDQVAFQHYAAGAPHFPDFGYPCTPAGERAAAEREKAGIEEWAKKPPAKRANWEALGTRTPFRADWAQLVGSEAAREPWLIEGGLVSEVVGAAKPLEETLNAFRAKRGLPALTAAPALASAVLRVSVNILGRGNPDDLAFIYAPSTEQRAVWAKALKGKSKMSDDELAQLGAKLPPDSTEIGRVLLGNYALAQGKGHAVGAVSAGKLLDLLRRDTASPLAEGRLDGLVFVRNREEELVRAARVEVVP